ncbi:hypothetical protein SAMN05443574_103187 [Haloarcula vallismortis]|uniref:Uncharacterized protein n=2 Tax=Haloarcula vallismortis TaxID=28442 RepID=M0JV11_HALVA|nr:hypothetical protein [Haloarcula vallismortis]EMA11485.1 hypothetical protein C437_01195 [Haloarcula vallismortis ATCC 29715]SDW42725.1 hypothetical protein SAMN05443574_103187 [Haloarcula vallismortis]
MTRRGQLVLVAATVVAVALVPILFASLQLGYHDDVRATADYHDDPSVDALRVLERAVATESASIPSQYAWAENDSAVATVRTGLGPRLDRLQTSRIEDGVHYNITYNETAAQQWEDANCPSGPARQFGDCATDRGVVVQNRVDRTHVLAVGFDVTTTTERGATTVTVVLEPSGRSSR